MNALNSNSMTMKVTSVTTNKVMTYRKIWCTSDRAMPRQPPWQPPHTHVCAPSIRSLEKTNAHYVHMYRPSIHQKNRKLIEGDIGCWRLAILKAALKPLLFCRKITPTGQTALLGHGQSGPPWTRPYGQITPTGQLVLHIAVDDHHDQVAVMQLHVVVVMAAAVQQQHLALLGQGRSHLVHKATGDVGKLVLGLHASLCHLLLAEKKWLSCIWGRGTGVERGHPRSKFMCIESRWYSKPPPIWVREKPDEM